MKLWVILALIGAGALTSFVQPGRFSYTFGYAILYVFLPPLLFEAAWNLDARVLLAQWRPILALAVPGVMVTCLIVGAFVWVAGLPVLPALLAGAIVSATDPIAVVAIFRRVRVPAGLSTIVQGEALLNDATAVMLFRAILLCTATTITFKSIGLVVALTVESTALGIAIGIALALLIGHVVVGRNSAAVQFVATLAGAYGAYLGAEILHASGIFAVIAFGITLREAERRSLAVETADVVADSWDIAALVANACVFFLTGAALNASRLVGAPLPEAAAAFGIFLSRIGLAYGLAPLAMGRSANATWLHVLHAAGARGALSLALALSVPVAIPFRTQIVDISFFAVVATLAASALVVPRAVRAIDRVDSPSGG